jgi:excisionase family DNA binding protein
VSQAFIMRTIEDLRKHLQEQFDRLDLACQHNTDWFTDASTAEMVEECQRLACRFGWSPIGPEPTRIKGRDALAILGKMLRWADEQCPFLDSSAACNYLGVTEQSLYGLVERKRLIPLRGPRRSYRFTKQMLDQYLADTEA